MNSIATWQNETDETYASMSTQKKICMKACKFIVNWLKENNKFCYEIFVDKQQVSKERNLYLYRLRAIDTFYRRAYIFRLSCRDNKFEISFTNISQNPKHLLEGDAKILLSEINADDSTSVSYW